MEIVDTILPIDLVEVDGTTPGKVDLMRSLNTCKL